MKNGRQKGRFWPISKLATRLEVSQSSVVAAARICQLPVLPGGVIRLPATKCAQRTDFIGEAVRSHQAESRQRARIHADC